MSKRVYWISESRQLRALTNPTRHDIVDRLTALGPLSVREIARALGRKQTSIYQHMRLLERVGLICTAQIDSSQGRPPTVVYRAVAPLIRFARAPRNPGNRGAMAKMAQAMAVRAARDYADGFRDPRWKIEGPLRNHWFFRLISAPSPKKLSQINRLLDQLAQLIWTPDPKPGPLIQVAWFMSPVPPRRRKE